MEVGNQQRGRGAAKLNVYPAPSSQGGWSLGCFMGTELCGAAQGGDLPRLCADLLYSRSQDARYKSSVTGDRAAKPQWFVDRRGARNQSCDNFPQQRRIEPLIITKSAMRAIGHEEILHEIVDADTPKVSVAEEAIGFQICGWHLK